MEAASPPHLSSSNKDFALVTDTIPLYVQPHRMVQVRPFLFAVTLPKGLPQYQRDSQGSPPEQENRSQSLCQKLHVSPAYLQPSGMHRRCWSAKPDPSTA